MANRKYKKTKTIRVICILSIVISIFAMMMIKYYYTKSFEWKGIYLKNGYKNIPVILLSTSIFIFFQGIIVKEKIYRIISVIGKNTMGIYYLHIPILVIIKKYLYQYINLEPGILLNLFKVVITILISFLLINIIKRIPLIKKIV